jgi:phage-related protein
LRKFPVTARRRAGYQLQQIQVGNDPDNSKPMSPIGPGVRDIRIRDQAGAFRVIYVAKFEDAINMLHCFQKQTQKTSQSDIALASKRYQDLAKELMR